MAKRLQLRGGTTTQHSTFIGADREVTIDTDKHVPVVHDGVTAGGHPLALASDSIKPDSMTVQEGKDAVYAAHVSKAAIENIEGMQSNGNQIDKAVSGDFDTNITVDTPVDSTAYGIDLHHSAGQGTATNRIAYVIHNYTDSVLAQFDNVGDNDIVILKNANNPTLRPDKDPEYVGQGNFLRLIRAEFNGGVQTGPTLFFIKPDAAMEWVYPNTSATFRNTKANDGTNYAFKWECSASPHTKFLNFDDKMKLDRNGSVNELKFDSTAKIYVDGVAIIGFSKFNTIFYKSLDLTGVGIKDSYGALPTEGQVLTGQAGGLCKWI